MLQRFEIVGNEKDKNFTYLVNCKLNKAISSTGELHWRLFTTGEQWRVENTKIDKDVWTIVGFISLMLAYVGSKFVLEVILHR